ncbi:MAG: TIGR03905 family TSCPD domain-containing protein [Treponema sp.]|jgi:uncharacterized protein (TIGR03905 family)|nr:TIGR03905 family TSCPD domain-containing protein [Treponema sp.]
MNYSYKTHGTCSVRIDISLEGDRVSDVRFIGGCDGNLQGIAKLVKGMKVSEVETKLSGIKCGRKATSCPDQLAAACREAYEKQNSCHPILQDS